MDSQYSKKYDDRTRKKPSLGESTVKNLNYNIIAWSDFSKLNLLYETRFSFQSLWLSSRWMKTKCQAAGNLVFSKQISENLFLKLAISHNVFFPSIVFSNSPLQHFRNLLQICEFSVPSCWYFIGSELMSHLSLHRFILAKIDKIWWVKICF